MEMDDLDLALVALILQEPDAGMREYARVLGVARGTVQARASWLERAGVLAGRRPVVGLAALGYSVQAYVHLHLAQGRLDDISAELAAIPEVLEAWSTTGEGDMLCRVAAIDNQHLEEVVQTLLAVPGVVRTRTEIALNERVPFRVEPLVAKARGRAGTRRRSSRARSTA
jgi:DNA-binding Lrp family transcriptional regulator